ncbi:extracellular solute-binding protein [Natrarchaeobius oligotrophus]|uniref:Extracellular solute-binding protein n=1 Tax=Natrarchaeobius chitinivorans TaxID=1679083 RepID=A0A3N6MEP4_NATCH|nr:extracellular solute-binding protein [Natrarchaeobius chitinivorans]RQH02464.1 extracellular solute-binding protein [Natrarchaeobius chitinivorans]
MVEGNQARTDRNRDATTRGANRTSRRAVLGAGSAALVSGLAGCVGGNGNGNGNGVGNGNGNGNGNGASGSDALDPDNPPEEPDSITVRAWGGVWEGSLAEHVGDAFTEETGIDVVYDNTDRTVMQGDIRTAIQQDREPPVNVNWTVEPALHEEYRMGLAEPLHPDIVTNSAEMFDLAIPDVDEDWLPYLVLYSYTYALSYNEEAMERAHGTTEPPEAWADFQSDEFENEFGQYDNGYGFWPVFSEISGTPIDADDLDPLFDTVEDFEPSIGHIGDDTSLTENIREGEIAGAPLIMNNLFEAYQDGEPVGWTIPEEGATAWGDGMYTPVNQSESELYWSQVFINYASAAENQEGWTEGLALPMLNQNVDPMDYMEDDPAYPTNEDDFDNLLTVDMDTYTEVSSSLYEEFDLIMGA